ncbi:neurotrophin-4-like [Heptranchias perlo]|uniref:neurotrophin-4-like n=1 Tax=Heptranchias perlo TaxID=212740 RepID=UPI003559D04C
MITFLYAMVVSYLGGIKAAPLQSNTALQGQGSPRDVLVPQTQPNDTEPVDEASDSHFLLQDIVPDLRGLGAEDSGKEWDFYSPRVTLAAQPPGAPPLLFIMEESLSQNQVANRTARMRRQSGISSVDPSRRGDLSVCDSSSGWVSDRRAAVDIHGKTVALLTDVPTSTGPLKQYFYETKCNEQSTTAQGGCRGVDKKRWISACKTKQSYVRALTMDAQKRAGWRWIRIDTSCVCTLINRTGRM